MEESHEEFGMQSLDDMHFEPPYVDITEEIDPAQELRDRIDALDTSCDGLFLIIDCAKYIGSAPDESEIKTHIRECEACHDANSDFLD
jgi:hypothetical protein